MSLRDRLKSWIASPRISPFVPKIVVCLLEGYSRKDFVCDLSAGMTVGIIALPLAMALAIASGLDPERGLYTAIVAGALNCLFSGSRFLIGGPTGAYVLLVYAVVHKYGYDGLACATIEAAIILFLLGFFKCGGLIRFIPYPVIVGFTCGISIVLVATQLKDFFGLQISEPAVDAVEKIELAVQHMNTFDTTSFILGVLTLGGIFFFRRWSKKFPGVMVTLCIITAAAALLHLNVETIETKFGLIPRSLPTPHWPNISFELLRKTFPNAVGIALLGAIESLLCAVIADSLAGTRHKSNCELVAQGISNFGSVLFGGIPSTGAIARTSISVQLQAKTPICGLVHCATILLLMLILAPLASKIPLAAIAAVLVYVAWGMFEFEQIKDLVRGWRSEALVMLATLVITVLVDLNVAVQTGVLFSVVLFLHRTTEASSGKLWHAIAKEERDETLSEDVGGAWLMDLPSDVKVYEIEGPFFFAVSDLLADIFIRFERTPKVLIVRMRSVPFIDVTAVQALRRFVRQCHEKGVALFIAELRPGVLSSLERADFFHEFPRERIVASVNKAVELSKVPMQASTTTQTVKV